MRARHVDAAKLLLLRLLASCWLRRPVRRLARQNQKNCLEHQQWDFRFGERFTTLDTLDGSNSNRLNPDSIQQAVFEDMLRVIPVLAYDAGSHHQDGRS